jgi:hypothetical protein
LFGTHHKRPFRILAAYVVGEWAAEYGGLRSADSDHRRLSPTLRGYLDTWQPRQRRTAGLQAGLFNRLDTLAQAHPEWEEYDLLTHVLAALHLITRAIGSPKATPVARSSRS